jgi:hypothetical protein
MPSAAQLPGVPARQGAPFGSGKKPAERGASCGSGFSLHASRLGRHEAPFVDLAFILSASAVNVLMRGPVESGLLAKGQWLDAGVSSRVRENRVSPSYN